jgi:hypothetical protein
MIPNNMGCGMIFVTFNFPFQAQMWLQLKERLATILEEDGAPHHFGLEASASSKGVPALPLS